MRLSEFHVYGLFGLFDHRVPLNLDERITILHAPNGFGKTVVLKLINAFFGGSLAAFREFEFESAQYHFDNGGVVIVEQVVRQYPSSRAGREERGFVISYRGTGEEYYWDPSDDQGVVPPWRGIPSSSWERYLGFVERVSTREWVDRRSGQRLSIEELYNQYGHLVPGRIHKPTRQPEWLEELRSSIHCRLIETQRLLALDKLKSTSSEPSMTLTVRTYSSDLQNSIERLLAESATLSQSLDQTFPNRLLTRMADEEVPLSESELRDRLSILDQQRDRLAKVGLLDTAKDDTVISGTQFNDATRRILGEYVSDTEKKLSIYKDTLEKLELFLEIINSRFQFKNISVSRSGGFFFTDIKGRYLTPENLSSGEQHELVLIYELLFRTKKDTLILIDEPEISLHIAWQKRFIKDLRRIISLTDFDAFLSTHSPQLIGKDMGLAVQLQRPTR
ncbi:putative ATP-binding protein involved in virulence [Rhizobium azibense]|nr:putative ATP-binding protein involved in virulence [Rhizobium azibense]